MSNLHQSNLSSWTYQVIVDPSFHNGDFGHAILLITSPSGEKVAAGYYPTNSPDSTKLPDFTGIHHVVEGPGYLRSEEKEITFPEYTFKSKSRVISEETASKLIDYVNNRNETPERYDVVDHNCVEFVEGAMEIAGNRLAIQKAYTPFLLKAQLETQEVVEDILGKVKSDVDKTTQYLGLDKDLELIGKLYLAFKKEIYEASPETAYREAALNNLSENFAKQIGDTSIYEFARHINDASVRELKSNIEQKEQQVHEAGMALSGRGY